MIQKIEYLNYRVNSLSQWSIFISIALIWVSVQYYFFYTIGVKLVPDSIQRYIPYAEQVVASGQIGESQENRYIIYIILIALSIKTKTGLIAVVLAQIAISGIACLFFYKAIKLLTDQNTLFAVIATLLFILWKDIQYLNVYILTESLFTSSIVIILYLLLRSRSYQDYVLVCALCFIPALLRPNGFIVLLSVLSCICYQHRHWLLQNKKLILAIVTISIVLVLAILDNYLLTTFQIVETYARGEVIYASDLFSIPAHNIKFPSEKESPLLRILYFILLNPVFFLKLFFSKLFIYLAYIKPYYSVIHNLSIALIIYPLYILTGYNTIKSLNSIKFFAPTIFVLQALIVAATSEDWDSRFIIPLLPVLMIFGTAGLHTLIKQKFNLPKL